MRQLQHKNIASFHEPSCDIVQRNKAKLQVESYVQQDLRLIIATSQHAVQALAESTTRRDIPLYVVGSASAQKAQAHGFRQVHFSGGTARLMLDDILHHYVPSEQPILYASGADTSLDVAAILRQEGYQATRLIMYEAQARPAFSAEFLQKLQQGAFSGVTFCSSRMAEIFAALAQKSGCESAKNLQVFALSPAVATVARNAGYVHLFTAKSPTLASLVDTVHHAAYGN